MKGAVRLCRVTLGLLMTAGVLAQGTAGGEPNAGSKEPPESVSRLSIEKPEAVAGESSTGHTDESSGSTRELKDAGRQERDQRDGLFILFLQILHTAK